MNTAKAYLTSFEDKKSASDKLRTLFKYFVDQFDKIGNFQNYG